MVTFSNLQSGAHGFKFVALKKESMKKRTDLLNGPIDSTLRLFALPLAFSFLVNIVYSLIDRFYASRLGDAAIAAIGTCDQVTFFLFTAVSGLATGTGIMVSRRFGEGNHEAASRTATQAITGIAVMSALLTVVMYVLMPLIPEVMRMSPEVSPLALEYMRTLYLGFTFNLVSFQVLTIIRSVGNSVFPMTVLLITTVINAALAPFLIFGLGPIPHMGLSGAGLATAIAQALGCVLGLMMVMRGKTSIHLTFANYKPDFALLKQVARLGIPSSIQMLSVSVNRAVIFILVGSYGTSVAAAYTLGLSLDMVVFMSVFAFGVAVEVATGQNLGARKLDRVEAYHRSAVKQMGILMLSLALVIWFFGSYFIGLYTSSADTAAEGLRYLHTTVFGYVAFAIGLVTIRSISGAGAPYLSMMITAGCLLFFQLPLSYLLSHVVNMGPQGIWWGIITGYIFFAIVALVIHRKGNWRAATV